MLTRDELDKGFTIGEWEVLPARGELRCGDTIIQPEPKVLGVLLSLAARDGDVVTKDELVEEVWDGRATADDPIIRCVYQLRGHLGDKEKPYQYVDTLVRRGYCLKQPVRLHEPAIGRPESVDESPPKRSRVWAIAALVIALGLAGLIYKEIIVPSSPTIGSIGVLPFENLTGDPANAYLSAGFKKTLVHTLQNIPDFAVKDGHVSYLDLEVPDIAAKLMVESVMFGALQREGDELKVNYQVARGVDGINVCSDQVNGHFKNMFGLQEKLAGMVRRCLTGGSNQRLLSSSRPANFEAYDRYIRGMYALERRGSAGNLEDAIALFEESKKLDPTYGPAYLALAQVYALLPDYRNAPIVASHERAIEIIGQGLAVDPAIRDAAAAVLGFVYHKQKKWSQAEEAFIRATSSPIVESNAFNWYSLMLGSVGRFDEALNQALAGLEIDPSSAVINSRVGIVYTWIGETEKAADYFDRANQLGGGTATQSLAHGLLLARQGKTEQAREMISAGVLRGGGTTDWVEPVFAALADPAQRDPALAAIKRASVDGQLNPQIDATLRMILGDTDGALEVARTLVQPGKTFETELLFLPEFRPLWQRPEFLELMDALGVTEYWAQAGCVWQDLAVQCT